MNCTVTAHFTAKEADLIYVGFRTLILNHITLKNTGRSSGAHPNFLTAKFFHRRGLYNEAFMEALYAAWKDLRATRGKPLQSSLDYVQIAGCALAVRTAVRQVRHGHMTPWDSGIQARANRLLRRLEAMRKRLKRTIKKTEGHNSFRDLASTWREFLKWLRLNLLSCRCLVRDRDPAYRSRQLLINEMVRVTTAELQAQQCPIPPARVLRKLVRDALKNVRRLRTPWTIPLLRRNPGFAAWWFGEYVMRRIAH
jgi:hypothetical protein